MIKVSNKLKVYLYSALILAGLEIILFTFSYIFAFNEEAGYFSSSLLPLFASTLCLISIVWFSSTGIFVPKKALDGASPTTLTVSIAATPLLLCELALGVILSIASFTISRNNIFGKLLPGYVVGSNLPNLTPLLLISGALLIVSAIYLAMLWFSQKKSSEIKVLVGFALPISSLLLAAIAYLDFFVTMNSPIKLSFQFAILSFMLFSLFELRVHLGKTKPRAYLSFAMIAMMLSGIASVPQIFAFAVGKFDDTMYLLYAILSFCIFIYVTARLITFVCARDLLERIADQTPDDNEEYFF